MAIPNCSKYGELFAPDAIEALSRILEAVPDARIVVESSWKELFGLSGLRRMWTNRRIPGMVYDITPMLPHEAILSLDLSNPEVLARFQGEAKGREVLTWMGRHAQAGDRLVVIDDAIGFPAELQPFVVQTDPDKGLTLEDAGKAITLLT